MSQFVLTFTFTYFWKQLQSTFYFMLQFLQWTILRILWVKGVCSLYLSIHGLRKGPGKFLMEGPGRSWIFSSERVGTLTTVLNILKLQHILKLFNCSIYLMNRQLLQLYKSILSFFFVERHWLALKHVTVIRHFHYSTTTYLIVFTTFQQTIFTGKQKLWKLNTANSDTLVSAIPPG